MYVRLHLCAVATWDKGQAEFRCRQCGALHHSTFKDLPSRARVRGEHFCEACGTTTTGKSSAYVPPERQTPDNPPLTETQLACFPLRPSSHAFAYFHDT